MRAFANNVLPVPGGVSPTTMERKIVTFGERNEHGYTYMKENVDKYNIPEYVNLCLFPNDDNNILLLPNRLDELDNIKPVRKAKVYIKDDGIYMDVFEDEYMNSYQFIGEGSLQNTSKGNVVDIFKLICVCGYINEYRENKIDKLLK